MVEASVSGARRTPQAETGGRARSRESTGNRVARSGGTGALGGTDVIPEHHDTVEVPGSSPVVPTIGAPCVTATDCGCGGAFVLSAAREMRGDLACLLHFRVSSASARCCPGIGRSSSNIVVSSGARWRRPRPGLYGAAPPLWNVLPTWDKVLMSDLPRELL